jgi:hypothetical protein
VLEQAGRQVTLIECHDHTLAEMIDVIDARLVAFRMVGLQGPRHRGCAGHGGGRSPSRHRRHRRLLATRRPPVLNARPSASPVLTKAVAAANGNYDISKVSPHSAADRQDRLGNPTPSQRCRNRTIG